MSKTSGPSGPSREEERRKVVERTRSRIERYMTQYVPGVLKTVVMKATRIRDVIATNGGSREIGVQYLEPSDLYRVRYEVATATLGTHYIFLECSLFRARLRVGLASDGAATGDSYEGWLQLLTGALVSSGWDVIFSDLEPPNSVELRASIRLPKDYIMDSQIYMKLAAQIAGAVGMLILETGKHGFYTLPTLPDRIDFD
jgi:hypothetical protein